MKIQKKKTLNFDDVLIVPKPSELESRSEVKLEVSYITKHSKVKINGFPVIAANMACIGTIEMAKALCKKQFFTALHKFIKEEDLTNFFNLNESKYTFYSLGSSNEEFNSFKKIYLKCNNLNKINIDVANGYTYNFLDRIKTIRDYFPNAVIMAGNVCTPEGVENIIKAGADIVKCGIGPGCFVAGTKITLRNKIKNIEDVKLGDEVLTHDGSYFKVVQLHSRFANKKLISINGIKCTPNHEFYAIYKDIENIINEKNLYLHAKWIKASDITSNNKLISIDNNGKFKLEEIKDISIININKEIVYDLGVERNHSYCVDNNIIVHNSFCETRNKAGIGYKQFSVALECGQAANELNALCCSDGGCKSVADICKALGAGSHFVMIGGMLAGYEECDSKWEYDDNGNKKRMFMYGMSSKYANDKFCGGLKSYRTSEGKEDWINYKGNVEELLQDICGGVASCCTYTNTRNLENLYKNCKFTI